MITYRTNGPWGAGKGSNLTPAEVDANFAELAGLINDALDGIAEPNSIADITYANGSITFVLSDATTRGPFDLPVAVFNWRGRYVGGRQYAEMDTLFHPAVGGYLVLQPHTAPATFNPALQIGGAPVYRLMFRLIPGGNLPTRDQGGSSYGLVLSDALTYVRLTAGGTVTVTVPSNADEAFPITTEITLRGVGSLVELEAAPGVTLNYPGGQTGTIRVNDNAFLKKVGTNEWDVWFSYLHVTNPPPVTETEPPSEPTEPATSEAGTAAGNFFAEEDTEGRRGRDVGRDLGVIFNPVDGFTVYELVEEASDPNYIRLEIMGDHTSLASMDLTVSGVGTVTLPTGSYDAGDDRTHFTKFDGNLGFAPDTWYTITLTPNL